MDINTIEVFETGDGKRFEKIEDAKKYNILLKKCDEVTNTMVSVPNYSEFQNGVGWIQHPERTKSNLEKKIVTLYNEWFDPSIKATELNYIIMRIIDDNSITCLNRLIGRYNCMTEDNKEVGQPYFVNNFHKVFGNKVN